MASSFIFYEDYWKAAMMLPKEKQMPFLKSIMDFGFYGGEIEDTGDPVVDMALIFIRTLVGTSLKNRENGAKGGRPPKTKNPPKTPLKPNDNVNDNVNVNENWNVNDNDNSNVNVNDNVNLKEKEKEKEKETASAEPQGGEPGLAFRSIASEETVTEKVDEIRRRIG